MALASRLPIHEWVPKRASAALRELISRRMVCSGIVNGGAFRGDFNCFAEIRSASHPGRA
jgi:hypothetical protein